MTMMSPDDTRVKYWQLANRSESKGTTDYSQKIGRFNCEDIHETSRYGVYENEMAKLRCNWATHHYHGSIQFNKVITYKQ